MWLLLAVVGLAAAFGMLVGYAVIAAIYALMLTVRLVAWAVLVTVHLGRSYFAPPPPSGEPPSST